MSYLIGAFLCYVLYRLFKLWRTVNAARKGYEEAYRQARDDYNDTYNRSDDRTTARKRYDEAEGEYADFEEMTGPREEVATESFSGTESQIEDADYEEIR
ncbi:MAG: hypothetical protein IJ808_00365 [Muribaculaceae bacterium]|nr:hypothetical protein [Muribaculaceae bacterium]